MSTKEFYDQRGKWRLKEKNSTFGAMSIPIEFRSPYSHLEEDISSLNEDITCLDLCCGDGVHSIGPAKRGMRVVGIDLSSDSIKAAQWLADFHEVNESSQFYSGDALQFLKDHPDSYNLIILSGSLYYFDLNEVMPLISKALTEGGHFICIGTCGDNLFSNIFRKIKHFFFKHRDKKTLKHLLKTQEIVSLNSYFKDSETQYFNFFTLFGHWMPQKFGIRNFYVKIVEPLDSILLNNFAFKRLAFKFYFKGKL